MAEKTGKKRKRRSLEELGYRFNAAGQLRTADDQPFAFESQEHYDELGEAVLEVVQGLLRGEGEGARARRLMAPLGLREEWLPSSERRLCNYFVSADVDKAERVLVLLQGSGAVRAGQWARALCINDGLETGTVIPYILRAQERGWAVAVLNPNLNKDETGEPIPGSKTAREHVVTVFDRLSTIAAKRIAIVAHSAGGIGTYHLLHARAGTAIIDKLCCVAFTDAVHGRVFDPDTDKSKAAEFLHERTINWVTSDLPLDTPVEGGSTPARSAGTKSHELTSSAAIEPVFAWLDRHMWAL